MAFIYTNLVKTDVTGAGRQQFDYHTDDDAADVSATGYFNAAVNMLQVGDTIIRKTYTSIDVASGFGTFVSQGLHRVTGINRTTGVVTIAPGTATATSLDTTPSVAGISILTTANAGSTTIDNFDDGVLGQTILVKAGDANTTFDFTASNLKGNVGANFAAASGDALLCTFDGTNWYCAVVDATA